MTSFVYFIGNTQLRDRVKIGVAKDPETRLLRLQTGSPVSLQLLAVMPGDADTEAALHRRFAGRRMKGEWFRRNEEIDELIARHAVEPIPAQKESLPPAAKEKTRQGATLLRIATVAARWEMSVKSIRRLIWTGELQAVRVGPAKRDLRVPFVEVERYESVAEVAT